jgi:hypothetical protein
MTAASTGADRWAWITTCLLGLQQWLSLLTLWQVPVWHGIPSRWTGLADSLILLTAACGMLTALGVVICAQRGLVDHRRAAISLVFVGLGLAVAVGFVIGFRLRVVP